MCVCVCVCIEVPMPEGRASVSFGTADTSVLNQATEAHAEIEVPQVGPRTTLPYLHTSRCFSDLQE